MAAKFQLIPAASGGMLILANSGFLDILRRVCVGMAAALDKMPPDTRVSDVDPTVLAAFASALSAETRPGMPTLIPGDDEPRAGPKPPIAG